MHERHSPKKYPTVYNYTTGVPIGKLANLSADGAMLITENPVKTADVLKCRIGLNHKILGLSEIIFDAECRWCRRNIEAGRWESGYRLNMTGIHKGLISYLTLKYGLDEWGDESVDDVLTIELESRRNSTRFEFKDAFPVYEKKGYRQIGQMADLSAQGVRLVTGNPVAKDDLLTLRVMLPFKIFQQEYLIFDARCMWCKARPNSDEFDSGYKIEQISEKDAAIVLHLLIHHGQPRKTKKRIQIVD